MCGRYASARNVDILAAEFEIAHREDDALPGPDYNVAPTDVVPVVVERDGGRVLTGMKWGLVPAWADDPAVGSRMINARLETVTERPAFRDAVVRRRCLLPADGWFEWADSPAGRQPFFLSPEDGAVLAFAGLWDVWHGPDGRELRTVTIVTGSAPADLAHVHDRAPVVVPRDVWSAWLDPSEQSPRELLRPTPSGVVVAHPVSPAVGDVRANGPHLLEPVEVVEQPPLF